MLLLNIIGRDSVLGGWQRYRLYFETGISNFLYGTLDQITKRSIARVIVQSLLKPDGTNFSIKKIENEDTSRPMTATDINEVAAVLNDLHDLLIEVRDNPSDEGRYFHS